MNINRSVVNFVLLLLVAGFFLGAFSVGNCSWLHGIFSNSEFDCEYSKGIDLDHDKDCDDLKNSEPKAPKVIVDSLNEDDEDD